MDTNNIRKEEIIEAYLTGLENGDLSDVPISDQVVFQGPLTPEPIIGKQEFIEFVSGLTQNFTKIEINVIGNIISGDSACSILEFILNDGAVVIPICDYFEFDGDNISKIRPYFDPRPLLKE